jgi:signal peptidase I
MISNLRDPQLEVKTCFFLLSNDSGSMEPAFQRGDILFLNNQDSPIRVGEIVVFKIKDRDIPIVHRVMKVHEKEDGKVRKSNFFQLFNTEDLVINHTAAFYNDCPSTKLNQIEVLTKGDNNRVDDRGLYAPGQLWLQREDILGRAKGTLRYLGMVTIILNDYPVLKYVLIGVMGLFVLTNKES